jgi:hypothetical protein
MKKLAKNGRFRERPAVSVCPAARAQPPVFPGLPVNWAYVGKKSSMQHTQNAIIATLNRSFGPESNNRLDAASTRDVEGACAALETFYYALHHRDGAVLRDVWLDNPLVQLNNPLGGIVRGREEIVALYERIFESRAAIQVRFEDAVEYCYGDVVVFAGRERGSYRSNDADLPLEIRTTRVFAFTSTLGAWRQIHHHGSIDDLATLDRYRHAVKGSSRNAST